MNLNTIKDFDFGVGPSNDTVRVATVPDDVSKSEVNLILWMILEHQLHQLDLAALRAATENLQRAAGERAEGASDVVDSSHPFFGLSPELISGLTARVRRRTVSHSGKARKYSEELLKRAGINLPFSQLSVLDKKDLFRQFSASSEMLKDHRQISSISELFDALRTKSKLKETFIVEQRLGGGNFGDVFSVIHRVTKKRYAAKRVSLAVDGFEEIKMTLNESRILRNLEHENIVQCTDAWLEMQHDPKKANANEQEPLKFYMLMDFCHQTLAEWIESVRKKPERHEVVLIIRQLIDGLKFLHSKPILHFDINPRNLMWVDSERTKVKICDFGLAVRGHSYPFRTGTEPYAAPDGIFTSKSDMYSLGVTMLEIAENIATTFELVHRISTNNLRTDFVFLNNVLPHLMAPNPNSRPTIGNLQGMLSRVINPRERQSMELEEEDKNIFDNAVADTSQEQKSPETERSSDEQEDRSEPSASAILTTEQEKPTEKEEQTEQEKPTEKEEQAEQEKPTEKEEQAEQEKPNEKEEQTEQEKSTKKEEQPEKDKPTEEKVDEESSTKDETGEETNDAKPDVDGNKTEDKEADAEENAGAENN